MSSSPLEYAPVPTRRRRRWVPWIIIVLAIGVAFSVPWPTTETNTLIDNITGSTRIITRHWWGQKTLSQSTSGIERRFKQLGLNWKPDWELMGIKTKSIFGNVLSRSCGFPSGTRLHNFENDIEKFASDSEVRTLFSNLTSGNQLQIDSAIQEATDIALLRDIQHANADGAASKDREFVP